MKNKSVYIVFLQTVNKMGRFVRFASGSTYSHVAISLDARLFTLYSFSRRRINAALDGGFMSEHPTHYLFPGKQDILIRVCRLSEPEWDVRRIRRVVRSYRMHSSSMIYNTFDAVFSIFRRKLAVPCTQTCIGFVTTALGYDDIFSIPELEKRLTPQVVYQGGYGAYLRKRHARIPRFPEDLYLIPLPLRQVIARTARHFAELLRRSAHASFS